MKVILLEDIKTLGRAGVMDACKAWRGCIESNKWPAYTDRTITVDPPSWLMARMMDAEFAEE